MKTDVDRKILEWTKNNAAMTYVWNHPGAMEEAIYATTQEFLTGRIDAAQAAQKLEENAEKWRRENPEAVKNFNIWAQEDVPFLKVK